MYNNPRPYISLNKDTGVMLMFKNYLIGLFMIIGVIIGGFITIGEKIKGA